MGAQGCRCQDAFELKTAEKKVEFENIQTQKVHTIRFEDSYDGDDGYANDDEREYSLFQPYTIVKEIEDVHEFKQVVMPDYAFASVLGAEKLSQWSSEVFQAGKPRPPVPSDGLEASPEDALLTPETTTSDEPPEAVDGYPRDGALYLLHGGRVYCGQWKQGVMHGEGVMYGPRGQKYEGQFVHGKRQGLGRLTWDDGRVYTGKFYDDHCHGYGTFIGSFGERHECTAVHGKIDLDWSTMDLPTDKCIC